MIYSVQSFISARGAREVFASSTALITPHHARTFGTWTTLSSVVRMYAAYNIHNKVAYELCLATWVIALMHFGTEWGVYGTARLSRGLVSPLVLAGVSAAWMGWSWGEYVK